MSDNDEPEETVKKRCFLGCAIKAPIISFTADSLASSIAILEHRKKHSLKYNDIELPKEIDDSIGYHSKCRNNFNALKARFKVDLNKPSGSKVPSPNVAINISAEGVDAENVDAENNDEDNWSDVDGVAHESNVKKSIGGNKGSSTNLACVFCNKSNKRVKGRSEGISTSVKWDKWDSVVIEAINCNNFETVVTITNYIDNEIKIPYHKSCLLDYRYLIAKKVPKAPGIWHKTRDCYKAAYAVVQNFIVKFIIKKKNAYTVDFITLLFKEALVDEYNKLKSSDGGEKVPEVLYTKHLSEKIQNTFKKKIRIDSYGKINVILPYGCIQIQIEAVKDNDILQKAALLLRRAILNNKTNKFGNNITAEDLMAGECGIPKQLTYFFTTILAAFNYSRRKSPRTARLVKSFASHLIHAVSNGQMIPSKHIALGSTIKSITNSKKIVRILHKYGHICSYNVIEELETEVTYASVDSARVCTSGVVLEAGLLTGCAFDNFDRYIDSVTVKSTTLNDTVGIVIQNITERVGHLTVERTNNCEDNESSTPLPRPAKRRRTFESSPLDVQPYFKKPKINDTVLPYDSPLRSINVENMDYVKTLDALWMISHSAGIVTPMWVGFNAKLYRTDNEVRQQVYYLTPINESPTDHAVVLETMRRALRIADECGEQYGQVTFDLGIARIALQLQSTEQNEFRRLFIHVGGFHVQMSYFKAIGTFINSCGLQTILVESGLLGSGSVQGFLSGTHFNRCKRLHLLMYLSLQMLQFKSFLEAQEITIGENLKQSLQKLQKEKCTIDSIINDDNMRDILKKFTEFQQETLNEKHGKTQKFYAIYLQLMGYYLLFERSIRTSDFDLYCYALDKLTNVFFAVNHQNYARWLVWYSNSLLNVDNTHPGLKEQFKKGSFGCKRTNKSFSRIPIDLTLEQTINADAGRRLTGISHITNSINARTRWAINHGLRCALISKVMLDCGLKVVEDITNDLHNRRIIRSADHANSFTTSMLQRVNPFSADVRKNALINVSTGQVAPDDVSNFLLNIETVGESMKKSMIEDCKENPDNFSKYVIKRNKILNFASCTKKMKMKVNGKIKEVKLQRDLFGRLLGIVWGSGEKINMEKVLTYPLTPVPFSLCHIDGIINKTDKSVLTKLLENPIKMSDNPQEHGEPTNIDIVLIDGMFLLHQLKQLPATLGAVAMKILNHVIATNPTAKDIYLIFDEYHSPSIKDNEHLLRDNFTEQFEFKGAEQQRPSDFAAQLKNINFKKAFVSFIMDYWGLEPSVKDVLRDKQLYVSFKRCLRYKVNDTSSLVCEIMPNLKCEGHDEADTKIAFFLCQLQEPKEVIIKCSDTDILVIVLGNMEQLSAPLTIWMLYGTGNNRRYINVNKIYDTLGSVKCSGLPAFHALTGCDYNPAFYQKGKRKPWALYLENEKYQQAFAALQDPRSDNYENAFDTLEDFVCKMYATIKNGVKKCSNVDEARLKIFSSTYTSNIEPTDEFKQKLKGFNACTLPPCKRELKQQLLRASYIGHMWKNAFSPVPNETLNILEFGWKLEDDMYSFQWFEGEDVPSNIQEIIEDPEETDGDDELLTYLPPSNFEDVEDDTDEDDSYCESDIEESTEDESVCYDTESVNNE